MTGGGTGGKPYDEQGHLHQRRKGDIPAPEINYGPDHHHEEWMGLVFIMVLAILCVIGGVWLLLS